MQTKPFHFAVVLLCLVLAITTPNTFAQTQPINAPQSEEIKNIQALLQQWYATPPYGKTHWLHMANSNAYTARTAILLLHARAPSGPEDRQGLQVEPLCDCADLTQVQSTTFKLQELKHRKAKVRVSVALPGGETRLMTLLLHKPNKFWVIDNIQSDRGFDLIKAATLHQLPNPPTGVVNEHSTVITQQLQDWYDHFRVGGSSIFLTPRKYLTHSTATQLIRVQNKTPKGEMGPIDIDPFVRVQDPSVIQDVRFHVLSADHQQARVQVKLEFVDHDHLAMELLLHHEKQGWRVHNLFPPEGPDFRKQLTEGLKALAH